MITFHYFLPPHIYWISATIAAVRYCITAMHNVNCEFVLLSTVPYIWRDWRPHSSSDIGPLTRNPRKTLKWNVDIDDWPISYPSQIILEFRKKLKSCSRRTGRATRGGAQTTQASAQSAAASTRGRPGQGPTPGSALTRRRSGPTRTPTAWLRTSPLSTRITPDYPWLSSFLSPGLGPSAWSARSGRPSRSPTWTLTGS